MCLGQERERDRAREIKKIEREREIERGREKNMHVLKIGWAKKMLSYLVLQIRDKST